MTQQSEADDSGDDGAKEAACPWLQPKGTTPTEMQADLAQLKSAFPGFSITICKRWDGPRFEAWRDTPQSGLYAIITDDPRELWRELNMAVR